VFNPIAAVVVNGVPTNWSVFTIVGVIIEIASANPTAGLSVTKLLVTCGITLKTDDSESANEDSARELIILPTPVVSVLGSTVEIFAFARIGSVPVDVTSV
jgi:hypothetical protein